MEEKITNLLVNSPEFNYFKKQAFIKGKNISSSKNQTFESNNMNESAQHFSSNNFSTFDVIGSRKMVSFGSNSSDFALDSAKKNLNNNSDYDFYTNFVKNKNALLENNYFSTTKNKNYFIPKKYFNVNNLKPNRSYDNLKQKIDESSPPKIEKDIKLNFFNKSFNSIDGNFLKTPERKNHRNITRSQINSKTNSRLNSTEKSPKRNRSNTPFVRIKEKLEGDFVHFLKRHRFSAILVGSESFKGKTADYYLKAKANHLNHTINIKDGFDYTTNNLSIISSETSRDNKIISYNTSNNSNFPTIKQSQKPPTNTTKNLNKNDFKDYPKQIQPGHKRVASQKIINSSFSSQTNKKLENKINSKSKLSTVNMKSASNSKTQKTKHLENTQKSVSQLRVIEKLMGYNKERVDLTPIPTRLNKPSGVTAIEYNEAERAAVTIRRIEYATNVNSKVDPIYAELQSTCFNLLVETKTIIIQRWWRHKLKILNKLNEMALLIQKQFRGYLTRVAFKTVVRQIFTTFPFLRSVSFVLDKKNIKRCLLVLRKRFAYLEFMNNLTRKVNLIIRSYRKFILKRKIKQNEIKKIVKLFSKASFKFAIDRISEYSQNIKKIIKLQARVRGMDFRKNADTNHHPHLLFYLKFRIFNQLKNKKEKAFDKLGYSIKKFRFDNLVKRIYYLTLKKRIQNIIYHLKNGSRKICIRKHFNHAKNKIITYRIFKAKVKMMTNYLKALLPISKKCFLRKSLNRWRHNLWKEKNSCVITQKVYSQILKLLIWNPFKQKVNCLYLANCKINAVKKLMRMKKKMYLTLANNKWKNLDNLMTKRNNLLKSCVKRKHLKTKFLHFEKLKKSCYYMFSDFPISFDFYNGVTQVKNVLTKALIRQYKSDYSALSNLKNVFKQNLILSKLKRLLKITNVYYFNKIKYNFDNWILTVNTLNNKESLKNSLLKKIINRTTKRKQIKMKSMLSKWSVKHLRKTSQLFSRSYNNSLTTAKGLIQFNRVVEKKVKTNFHTLLENIGKIKRLKAFTTILFIVLKRNLKYNINSTFRSMFNNQKKCNCTDSRLKKALLKSLVFTAAENQKTKFRYLFRKWVSLKNKYLTIEKKLRSIGIINKVKVNQFSNHQKKTHFFKWVAQNYVSKNNESEIQESQHDQKFIIDLFRTNILNHFYKFFFSKLNSKYSFKKSEDYYRNINTSVSALNKSVKNLIYDRIKDKINLGDRNHTLTSNFKLKDTKTRFKILNSQEEQLLTRICSTLQNKFNNVLSDYLNKFRKYVLIRLNKLKKLSQCLLKRNKNNQTQILNYYLLKWKSYNKHVSIIESSKEFNAKFKNYFVNCAKKLHTGEFKRLFENLQKFNILKNINRKLIQEKRFNFFNNLLSIKKIKILNIFCIRLTKIMLGKLVFSINEFNDNKLAYENSQLQIIKLEKIKQVLLSLVDKKNTQLRDIKKYYFTYFRKATNMLFMNVCTKTFKIIFKKRKQNNPITRKVNLLKHIIKKFGKINAPVNILHLKFSKWKKVYKISKLISAATLIQRRWKNYKKSKVDSQNTNSIKYFISPKIKSTITKYIAYKDLTLKKVLNFYFSLWHRYIHLEALNKSVVIITDFIYKCIMRRRMKIFFRKVKTREFVISLIQTLHTLRSNE